MEEHIFKELRPKVWWWITLSSCTGCALHNPKGTIQILNIVDLSLYCNSFRVDGSKVSSGRDTLSCELIRPDVGTEKQLQYSATVARVDMCAKDRRT